MKSENVERAAANEFRVSLMEQKRTEDDSSKLVRRRRRGVKDFFLLK